MRRKHPLQPAEQPPQTPVQHLGGWLVLPGEVRPGRLTFRDRLEAVTPLPERELMEQGGGRQVYIVPGFIDTHVHGGGGGDLMDGAAGLETLSRFHARCGTTSLLPTTMTAPWASILEALGAAASFQRLQQSGRLPGTAQVLGAHLEGPFISPGRLGAQPDFTLLPELDRVAELLATETLAAVTLAPEQPGALEAGLAFAEAGVRVGIGHTCADAETTWDFLERVSAVGPVAATHLFNAVGGLSARSPGALGALLAHPAPFYEVIADLQHVHPVNLRLVAARGPERLTLITDAMRAAGQPNGESELGGQAVTVQDGRATLADGTLAGSVLTMDTGFRNLVRSVGLSLPEASRAASANPAHSLGLRDRGELRPGQRADLVVLDEDLNVLDVYIAGERLEK